MSGVEGWAPGIGDHPFPPANVQVYSPLFVGALDIRWDDPKINPCNQGFDIVGVNIYRSDTSERGPYRRINRFPVGGTFYRDQTDNRYIENEVVDDYQWLSRGETANNGMWRFRTKCCPAVKKSGQAIAANAPMDVQVVINGKIVPVHSVFGPTGEVTLINAPVWDLAREEPIPPSLPEKPTDTISISYYCNSNLVKQDLDQKLWYRVTTVANCFDPKTGEPLTPSGLTETPLEFAQPKSAIEIETMDWIWREAIRRNNWILEQGGERAKVFIRKTAGVRCFCGLDPRTVEFGQQPKNRCPTCFGTGYVGGFEGPYDIIVSPDDSDRTVAQSPSGRHLEHLWDVWTGPSPSLTMRDFLVRQNNERYAIGGIRKPSNRGNVMQQFFQMAYMDEQDIRYLVPMEDPSNLTWPECRIMPPTLAGGAWRSFSPFGPYAVGVQKTIPMETEKENIPDERELRGRTPVWQNITY